MSTTFDDLLVLMATDASFARSVKDRPDEVAIRYGVSAEDLATLSAIRVDGRARRPRALEERLSRSAILLGTESAAGADVDSGGGDGGESGDDQDSGSDESRPTSEDTSSEDEHDSTDGRSDGDSSSGAGTSEDELSRAEEEDEDSEHEEERAGDQDDSPEDERRGPEDGEGRGSDDAERMEDADTVGPESDPEVEPGPEEERAPGTNDTTRTDNGSSSPTNRGAAVAPGATDHAAATPSGGSAVGGSAPSSIGGAGQETGHGAQPHIPRPPDLAAVPVVRPGDPSVSVPTPAATSGPGTTTASMPGSSAADGQRGAGSVEGAQGPGVRPDAAAWDGAAWDGAAEHFRSELAELVGDAPGRPAQEIATEISELVWATMEREISRVLTEGFASVGQEAPPWLAAFLDRGSEPQGTEPQGTEPQGTEPQGTGARLEVNDDGTTTSVVVHEDGTRTAATVLQDGRQVVERLDATGSLADSTVLSADGRSSWSVDHVTGSYTDVRPGPDGLPVETVHRAGVDGFTTRYAGEPVSVGPDGSGRYVAWVEHPGGATEVIPLRHADADNGNGTSTRTFTFPNGRVDTVLLDADGAVVEVESTPGGEGAGKEQLVWWHDGAVHTVHLSGQPDGTLAGTYLDGAITRTVAQDPATGVFTFTVERPGEEPEITWADVTGAPIPAPGASSDLDGGGREQPSEGPNALRALRQAGVDVLPGSDRPTVYERLAGLESGSTSSIPVVGVSSDPSAIFRAAEPVPKGSITSSEDGSWSATTDDGRGNQTETTMAANGTGQRVETSANGATRTFDVTTYEDGSRSEIWATPRGGEGHVYHADGSLTTTITRAETAPPDLITTTISTRTDGTSTVTVTDMYGAVLHQGEAAPPTIAADLEARAQAAAAPYLTQIDQVQTRIDAVRTGLETELAEIEARATAAAAPYVNDAAKLQRDAENLLAQVGGLPPEAQDVIDRLTADASGLRAQADDLLLQGSAIADQVRAGGEELRRQADAVLAPLLEQVDELTAEAERYANEAKAKLLAEVNRVAPALVGLVGKIAEPLAMVPDPAKLPQYAEEIAENLRRTFGIEDVLNPNAAGIEAAQESSLGYDTFNDATGGMLSLADETLGPGTGRLIYDSIETIDDLNGIVGTIASTGSPLALALSAYNFIADGGLEDVGRVASDGAEAVGEWVSDGAKWVWKAGGTVIDAAGEAGAAIVGGFVDTGEAIVEGIGDAGKAIGDFLGL